MSQTFQEFLDSVSSAQLDEATPGEDNPKSPEELKAKRRGKKATKNQLMEKLMQHQKLMTQMIQTKKNLNQNLR